MPVVDIKGVGPAQFPDGMSVDDIRSFLRNKYAQQAISGQSDILAPVSDTATAYEPTLAERMGQTVSDALYDTGIISDRYGAQRIGGNIATIGEFLPGIGDATAGDDVGRALAQGNYGEAALGAIGTIPVLGDMAIFAGALAKNADLGALRKAQELEIQGAERTEIWKDTGWVNDKGDWKFEIDDSSAFIDQPTKRFDKHLSEYERQIESYKTDSVEDLKLEMEMMEYKGEPEIYRAENIKRLEGEVFDITTSEYPLAAALGHESLYDNYPKVGDTNIRFSKGGGLMGAEGSYTPSKNLITVKKDNPNNLSIGLHETQHALQRTEDFQTGGNLNNARYALEDYGRDAARPFATDYNQTRYINQDLTPLGKAKYISYLDNIVAKTDPTPSSVTNLSDWYQYSGEIRDRLGIMPKTKQKGRSGWLRSAAAFIRNKNLEELPYSEQDKIIDLASDQKALKSKIGKLERQKKKYEVGNREYRAITGRIDDLKKKTDFELYQRLAGEAEARNVQTRLDWTPEQRRETPPWESLDVPESELIYRR